VNDYGLDDSGSEFESSQFQEFSLLHIFHTGFSYQMVPWILSTLAKRLEREIDHSARITFEVKEIPTLHGVVLD
jgi:hypothetical protein